MPCDHPQHVGSIREYAHRCIGDSLGIYIARSAVLAVMSDCDIPTSDGTALRNLRGLSVIAQAAAQHASSVVRR